MARLTRLGDFKSEISDYSHRNQEAITQNPELKIMKIRNK